MQQNMLDDKLTDLQAFYAMRLFLEKYYEQTQSDDVGSLLGDLQFFEKEKETADPAAWKEWMECVNKVLAEKNKKFEPDKLYR